MKAEQALKQRIEQALDTVLAQMIVDEVLRRIAELPFDCLVLFNGSAQGFEDALSSLEGLKGSKRLRLHAAWTPAAARLLCPDRIKKALGSPPFDLSDRSLPPLLRDADLILLPTLTLSTAAKLALCIQDCPASRLLADALIRGKRLLAGTQGVLPLGPHVPAAYRKTAQGYLAQLAEYGVRLTDAQHIGREARTIAERGGFSPAAPQAFRLKERILSLAALNGIPPGARVCIPKDAVVTPLAQDAIRERGILLHHE